ncbi:MAG: hypothetical protein PHY77_06655, partial [Desulfotomaculaceae bacterium]|nr:hypothetical protein [Desulfotomaculaceae bacterium]
MNDYLMQYGEVFSIVMFFMPPVLLLMAFMRDRFTRNINQCHLIPGNYPGRQQSFSVDVGINALTHEVDDE